MNGKSALITGASSGIGRVFAKRLAQEGYTVTAVSRNREKLEELLTGLDGSGHSFEVADLSTVAGSEKIAKVIGSKHFDILVNNAGRGLYGRFQDTSLEIQREMVRLNCDAVVTLSHAFLNHAQKGDALVNVSSFLAFVPMPMAPLYCATKAFVTSLSESLWFEQKDRGVYVVGICPGITSTEFHVTAGIRDPNDLPKQLVGTPEAVVETAIQALTSRDKPTVIVGGINRTLTGVTRMLSRKSLLNMMGKAN